MDGDGSDVVGVRFEGGDLLGGVVVVDTELEVIRPANNPVLPRNESTGTNGDIGELEGFDYRLEGPCELHSTQLTMQNHTCVSYDQM